MEEHNEIMLAKLRAKLQTLAPKTRDEIQNRLNDLLAFDMALANTRLFAPSPRPRSAVAIEYGLSKQLAEQQERKLIVRVQSIMTQVIRRKEKRK